ncbi:uncharacterized protein MELLADRAFT_54115 [Melampsora larici-populina 98AG31]|uniref:Uncharacterized protein n=1 Tax=Melampsora larici-populina (strain 98AG31 / pathotype 3-4-7) TaxID=747676 RepID=F4S910_MELLP|nr:uncharacterized protein MELLADRAFT_54115 [Melampsora larici-populina 98AG31]EGF98867.1 hypothetical protein MELLADRAFT_54115 [Melampsora larici-populina 98AG31]
MSACACDDVRLWGVRTALEVKGECWICKDYVPLLSPRQIQYSLRQDRLYNASNGSRSSVSNGSGKSSFHLNHIKVAPKAKSTNHGNIRHRHRQLTVYQLKYKRVKAQRNIKVLIENKLRDDRASIREALYLVYTYNGPFLQKVGDKGKAGAFLRREGLGAMFVKMEDQEVKWEWLQNRVNDGEDEIHLV